MATKNTPPTAQEARNIEAELKAMIDAAEKAQGFESLSSGEVDAWCGTRVRPDGEIAGRDDPGHVYPVQGIYRGLYKLGLEDRQNPFYYVIELTRPAFAKRRDEPTFLAQPGTLIGYGLRKTLDLTTCRDGDEVIIIPTKQVKVTSDKSKWYWLFAKKVLRKPEARRAPNAMLNPAGVGGAASTPVDAEFIEADRF